MALYPFLPSYTKAAFDLVLRNNKLKQLPEDISQQMEINIVHTNNQRYIKIGDIQMRIKKQHETVPSLVPKVSFFRNNTQTLIIKDLMEVIMF